MHAIHLSFIKRCCLSLLGALLVALALSADAHAVDTSTAGGTVIVPPTITLTEITRAVENPVFVTNANDGSDRLFILERPGRIRIVQNGDLLETPFLDISQKVTTQSECGLLSMAFAPDFAERGEFYVYYSYDVDALGDLIGPAVPEEPNGGCDTVIARFSVSDDGNVADVESEEAVLLVNQPYVNHNGGQISFGPDGYLYIALGDGGSGGDPHDLAQNPASLLGKILRIDVLGQATYVTPADNPFVEVEGFAPEIWALGVRNPWRFSFDRLTGDFYMADVGQNRVEEINFQPAEHQGGANYGWDTVEGDRCYPGGTGCDQSGLTAPVFVYEHGTDGGFCNGSVTGGYVHRTAGESPLNGLYIFGDYCLNQISALYPPTSGTTATWRAALLRNVDFNVLSFGEDEAGAVYVTGSDNGVYRIDTLDVGAYLPLIRR